MHTMHTIYKKYTCNWENIFPTKNKLRYKAPNEIGNHRQISPYVANYQNELCFFTYELEC